MSFWNCPSCLHAYAYTQTLTLTHHQTCRKNYASCNSKLGVATNSPYVYVRAVKNRTLASKVCAFATGRLTNTAAKVCSNGLLSALEVGVVAVVGSAHPHIVRGILCYHSSVYGPGRAVLTHVSNILPPNVCDRTSAMRVFKTLEYRF